VTGASLLLDEQVGRGFERVRHERGDDVEQATNRFGADTSNEELVAWCSESAVVLLPNDATHSPGIWGSRTHRVADLWIRADTVGEIRDTVSKLAETGFEDCHRIRIRDGGGFTVRSCPRFVVDLEVTRSHVLVGIILMPAAGPLCSWFGVLDSEPITVGPRTPLELEGRFASIRPLVEKDRAVECRHETDRPHRTRFSDHGRDASGSSKSSCNSFVDLVPVKMRVTRNWRLSHSLSPSQLADAKRGSRVASIVSYS
jgi:hypothetical protein